MLAIISIRCGKKYMKNAPATIPTGIIIQIQIKAIVRCVIAYSFSFEFASKTHVYILDAESMDFVTNFLRKFVKSAVKSLQHVAADFAVHGAVFGVDDVDHFLDLVGAEDVFADQQAGDGGQVQFQVFVFTLQ